MNVSDRVRKVGLWFTFNIAAVLLLLALCEGIASFILFFKEVTANQALAERRHTQYDELLGWVNTPNLYLADMYGPGVYLQTNSQGFRNKQDFNPEPPDNKLRIICSGDSFTFGYGVDNDHTWCQLLAARDERLETVNMGQGGYGVDQAYLWYKRDGQKLEHDIHLFAFITTDFKRMQRDEFNGYAKPLLKVQNDTLLVTNVPVPWRSFYLPWLTQNREAIDDLKSTQLLRSFFLPEPGTASADQPAAGESSPEVVAAKILADLIKLNQAKNSTLVLVYLPGQDFTDDDLDHWRQVIHTAAERQSVPLLDLVDTFKGLPAGELDSLFIQKGEIDYQGAAGHYTVKGNQYVADVLYEQLMALPEIAAKQ
ncbi:MAG: hypothetical protein HS114_26750 [Anaerolineales bacterium]|nr:hypothetical protein [Anaerolineales bacterium]